MAEAPYAVSSYSIDTLKRLLAQKTGAESSVVEAKLHTIFFEEYFKSLGAKTIVVENDYVDRDYLEDFAAYYVRCFPSYKRFCTRLHFFTEAFNQEEFAALISGTTARIDEHALRKGYLGFVVLKPLPQTVIGRTCLSSYPHNAARSYPVLRDYDAHLPARRTPGPLPEKTRPLPGACSTSSACAHIDAICAAVQVGPPWPHPGQTGR